MAQELPLPPHYDPEKVGQVWRVDYEALARAAPAWTARWGLRPAAEDRRQIALLAVDVQNTFCVPGFELFVAGRSGTAAVEDNRRLCAFLYRNLGRITRIYLTLDTHRAVQVFHSVFLVDAQGRHPEPYTVVRAADVEAGRWRFNVALAPGLGLSPEAGQRHLLHYTQTLERSGKYALTIWPYHALLGGIGHALVAAVEEAVFFHTLARASQPGFLVKGDHPLTEHYSALGPEVTVDAEGRPLGSRDTTLLDVLEAYDAVIVAGQAKSHCVAWTVADLLALARERDAALVKKVYLLEDCTSPVVVPGGPDFTEEAEAAFRRFAEAGMHRVRSSEPLDRWPGFPDHN